MKAILHIGAVFAAAWTICPAAAQNLAGAVTAADTGGPLVGVTVTGYRVGASASQKPTVYQALTDGNGNYSIAAPAGQYLLCARPQPQSLYLDPCQWGVPVSAAAAATPTPAALSLQKGVRFIVRVHDPNQLLPQAETAPGTAVSAYLTSASIGQFQLAVVMRTPSFAITGPWSRSTFP